MSWSKRDQKIIELVHRYRLMLPSILHKRFFSHASLNAVTQVTRRLVAQEYLTKHTLLAQRKYFRPGPAAVKKRAGWRTSETKKLPPQTIPVELAALLYCCDAGQHRLTPREVVETYKDFPPELLWQHPYFIDDDGESKRLAMIRVELSASPPSILKKLKKSIYRLNDEYPGFRSLYDSDQLKLVVVSPNNELLFGTSEEKEDPNSLYCLLQKEQWIPDTHLYPLPDLLHFVP